MSRQGRYTIAAFGVLFGVSIWTVQPLAQAPATPPAAPQSTVAPTNDAPNPYETVEGYFKMPDGRTWGSTSAVDIDRDGKADLVATGGDTVRVLLGDGRGSFKAAPGSPFTVGKGSWRLVVTDLNGDGKLDVATCGVEDDTVWILLGR